jgi:DNA-binding transcriptional regulator YdaS (Cro superfamily)
MPVGTREKLRALTEDLGGQSKVAQMLGVSRSRVSRWLRTERPDPENRRKLEAIEFVLARLLERYELATALKWLRGVNAHLGDRRPVDLLASGRVAEVLAAVEADETGAYA